MTATFHYSRDPERGTESIVVSGNVVRTVASSHPNFVKIRNYCFTQSNNGQEIDLDHVLRLTDAGETMVEGLLRITDRVSYKGGNLLWDGVAVEGALASHIVRMVKAGDDNYAAFALFLENLDQNPSEVSKAALFDWIADRDFTITPEGHFVAYKGVHENYQSKQSGYGIVNGVEVARGCLDNTPGNVVEVPRNMVDEDRNSACSFGLHVGTRSYATSYAARGKMITVAVNPRDVVMVPRDGGGEKMRVCRYVVLEDNPDEQGELKTTTYLGKHRAENFVGPVVGEESQFCEQCAAALVDGECAYCADVDDSCSVCGYYVENCTCDDECSVSCDGCADCDDGWDDDEEDEEEFSCQSCGASTDEDTDECAYCADLGGQEDEDDDESEQAVPGPESVTEPFSEADVPRRTPTFWERLRGL